MAAPLVTIQHPDINSNVAVRLMCQQANVSGKKINISKENANSTSPTELQTQTQGNLMFAITGINFTGAVNTLTYAHLMTLYRLKYAGLDHATQPQVKLVIRYGNSTLGSSYVTGSAATAPTEIPVMLDSFSFPISMTDSKDGYMPVASLTFAETG